MESRAKIFGHPVHPLLIVFPLGLLTAVVVFDIIHFFTDSVRAAAASYYNVIAGILGGLVAAIFGLWDWLAIPGRTRAKRIGLLHGLGNVVVLLLFAVSWWLRRDAQDYVPGVWAFLTALAGIALSLLTGWLGGELVYRLRVGVDDGAHLDASNSLSGEPATLPADRS